MPRVRLGAEAEDRAARYLFEKGYTIVTRGYKTRRGELDLVAMDGDTMVFVEVKQRAAGSLPELAVSAAKQARIVGAAQAYLRDMDARPVAVRFDVVAIEGDEIRHHEGAFG